MEQIMVKELPARMVQSGRGIRSFLRVASSRTLVFILPLFCQPVLTLLQAQLTRGGLTGTVVDPSGARIPGALVRITEVHTNSRRESFTNEVGMYRFSAVEPGSYDVEFEAGGFSASQLRDIQISASREIVLNRTMSVEDQAATVQVYAASDGQQPLDLSVDVSVANAIYLERDTLAAAPFLSPLRDPQLAALFLPTVTRAPAFSGFSGGGQRSRNQNFTLDGTDNNDLVVTGASMRLIPEEISELQIRFPAFSAEFGQTTGTQVSVITLGGTNAIHGSAWNYFRSNKLEPLALVDKRAGFTSSPRFSQNQAGGSLGGPLRKDRTFFFLSVEASRRHEEASTRNASTITIPTEQAFRVLQNVPLGASQSLSSRLRALNGLAFLQDVYPHSAALSDTVIRTINGAPLEFVTLRIPVASPSSLWHGLVRGDHSMGQAGNLSYRFLFDKRTQRNSASNLQFAERFAASSEIFSQSHTASLSYAFSSSWMTENRFSFTRANLDFPENDPLSPTVQILGGFTFGGLSSFPQGRRANTLQWQHQSSHSLGIHVVKFGADVRRNRLSNLAAFDSKGTWTFNNFADYLNSQPSRIRQLLTDSSYNARQTNQSYFVQDDLRLRPNVSVNVGVRYELSGVPNGFFGTTDQALEALGVPAPTRRDVNNIAPRLGAAFAPGIRSGWARHLLGENATVLRAGYSINYDVIYFNVLTVAAGNYPRALKYDVLAPESFGLFPQLLPAPAQLPGFDPLRFPFANATADLQNPTAHNWMLSVRREFGPHQSVEAGYVGNRSYHLLRQSERNPGLLSREQAEAVKREAGIPGVQDRRLNPGWASRAVIESTAISKYHAGYLRHSQSLLKGLRSEVSLTWSATFSDNDEPLAIGDIVLSSPQTPQSVFDYRREWSRSVFDRPVRSSAFFSYQLARRLLYKAPLLNQIFTGWSFSGFAEWQSGQPFTVVTGVDSGGSGISSGWRPDLLPNQPMWRDPATGDLRTFAADGRFQTPRTASGTPLAHSMAGGGNLGRNTYRGPSFTLWNLNLAKVIELTETLRVQLRGDFINAWNHRNFGNPVANMNNSAFGSNTTDPGNRSVLLSVKVSF